MLIPSLNIRSMNSKVFTEEREEFRKLIPKKAETIKLVTDKRAEWKQLKQIYIDKLKNHKKANEDAGKIIDLKSLSVSMKEDANSLFFHRNSKQAEPRVGELQGLFHFSDTEGWPNKNIVAIFWHLQRSGKRYPKEHVPWDVARIALIRKMMNIVMGDHCNALPGWCGISFSGISLC